MSVLVLKKVIFLGSIYKSGMWSVRPLREGRCGQWWCQWGCLGSFPSSSCEPRRPPQCWKCPQDKPWGSDLKAGTQLKLQGFAPEGVSTFLLLLLRFFRVFLWCNTKIMEVFIWWGSDSLLQPAVIIWQKENCWLQSWFQGFRNTWGWKGLM